ncbi:4-hydroxy-3-methylbut-2-enyl diphosphate reductase [Candidatus Providencia siddallii]|uniref:4-hydroxy-3-methylbut-2-enyl diphosphate reductase n=1 Tax=Candidatus Providencia siddallii TaxID=1715285 RepID=A0A0M6W7V9_9GAMM|nr:4-hydroxy-3-methylbut-2-enyl diphosphate reductase [Candidatus Providencia siddallii]
MKILMANPRGFCAGVKRAISIVDKALKKYGSPIYVKHELVHNQYIVDSLKRQGVIFIEELSEVPKDSILIFSAHGVSKTFSKEAYSRKLGLIYDATCPLVKKIHIEVLKASNEDSEVILIGHKEHPEIQGTIGYYSSAIGGIYIVTSKEDVWKLHVKNKKNLYFVTQTTLSIDDTSDIINSIITRFPNIIRPRRDNICYATRNRQEATKKIAKFSDIVFVIGSKNSSNSNRLVELVLKLKKQAYLIDDVKDINSDWLINVKIIGLTAGASAPDVLINKVINRLKKFGVNSIVEF